MDFTNYDDEQLDALRIEVLTEQERRARANELPEQIAGLVREAVAAGAHPDALLETVKDAIAPTEMEAAGVINTARNPETADVSLRDKDNPV
ncbi:hypothetical protein [Devriesea agamarum]|uniref:hypothetical protein n=1 Tax=Devriesea agamarum TaxID=472569 RepID=UPI00071D5D3A|nr:hypothetical protein [Devriesea agamarum]